ncbi:MAG: MFS transporter [Bacteroidota bacterium]
MKQEPAREAGGQEAHAVSQISKEEIERSLHYSVVEVAYAGVLGNLGGGVILTGFLLALRASDVQIGIMGALPFFAYLWMLHGSYLVERSGDRKRVMLTAIWIARSIWPIVILLPFVHILGIEERRVGIFLLLYAVYNIFNAIGGLAYTSWLVDLVPEDMRGRFFAKRNFALGFTGMATAILGGVFLDLWNKHIPNREMEAFAIAFGVATVAGFVSNYYLKKIAHPPLHQEELGGPFWKLVQRPLQDKNFRQLILLRIVLDTSLNMAGPFFVVYMIREMGLGFSFATAMTAIAGATSLVSMNAWGKLSDRYGNKPLLAISIVGKGIFPLIWLWTSPETFALYIIAHMFGVFDAGINLTAGNIVFEVAPKAYTSVYFGVFFTAIGAASAVAPVLGGYLLQALHGVEIHLGVVSISHFKILFLISAIVRFATLPLLKRVHEPEARPVGEVVRVIWNAWSMNPVEGLLQTLRYLLAPARFISKRISRRGDSDEQ